MSEQLILTAEDISEARRQALIVAERRYENLCFLSDKRDAEKRAEIEQLRAQIADLELQHVGDKAIIEALNARVGRLKSGNEALLHALAKAEGSISKLEKGVTAE